LRSYVPIAGDVPLLRHGIALLAAERFGLLVPPYHYGLEHKTTWRQCNENGGSCAYYYAGRGGYVDDCDNVITDYFASLNFGRTQLRGWAYAYVPAHNLDAASDLTDSVALAGWLEFDLWVHTGDDPYVTRLARRIRHGKITMARRDGFNGRVPAGILGFSGVTYRSGHYIRHHPRPDPWW
jgi:hypothetical protein